MTGQPGTASVPGGTVPPPVPGTVPGGTAASAAPGPGTSAGVPPRHLPLAPPPALPSDVVPVTVPERAASAARHAGGAALSAARGLWLEPGRLIHVIVHGQAETMAEHRAYVKSRAWVPDGMEGAAEKAVTIAGLAHYLIVARPLKASMKAVKFAAEKVDQAADRAVGFYIPAVIVIALIVLLSVYL